MAPRLYFLRLLFLKRSWCRCYSFLLTALFIIFFQRSAIAGLEINFDSNLQLSPHILSYQDGLLNVNSDSQKYSIKIDPKTLGEILEIVEKTDEETFQVSIDSTALGNWGYLDDELRSITRQKQTRLGNLLLNSDKEFASLVNGYLELPEDAPREPNAEALNLLANDTAYKALTEKWLRPPISWPQIYLFFDPQAEGLVRIEAHPQILFQSPGGHSVKASDDEISIAERPFKPLLNDIQRRPLEYREASDLIDFAASVTAAFGILKASCQLPGICSNLQKQISIATTPYVLEKAKYKEYSEYKALLQREWVGLALTDFEANGNSKAFGKTYSILRFFQHKREAEKFMNTYQALYPKYIEVSNKQKKPEFKIDDLSQDEKDISFLFSRFFKKYDYVMAYKDHEDFERVLNLADKNFLYHPVSELPYVSSSPSLYAASALNRVKQGRDSTEALKDLNKAIEMSSETNLLGTRIEVSKMGLVIADLLIEEGDERNGKRLQWQMQSYLNEARANFFDAISNDLKKCEQSIENCSLDDLLRLEAESFRGGLEVITPKTWNDKLPSASIEHSKDLAWLHGRFSYLIGMMLEDPTQKKNRLRYLENYSESGLAHSPSHKNHLRQLKVELEYAISRTSPQKLIEIKEREVIYLAFFLVCHYFFSRGKHNVSYIDEFLKNR